MGAERVVVIVAHRADVHAHAVHTACTALGVKTLILDVQEFTTEYHLSSSFEPSGSTLTMTTPQNRRLLALEDIAGLWWRRPYAYATDLTSTKVRSPLDDAVRNERRAALIGSLDALVHNSFNELSASRRAANKPRQLVQARQLGLQVPRTLVTNDPAAVEGFHRSTGGETVCKMFHGSPFGLYGTRRITRDDLDHLGDLITCPAIFQEYIPGQFDVRVVVVGDRHFAARIDYEPLEDVIDTRFVETKISPHVLPEAVSSALVRLVRDSGLVYSAIDMRYSDERGYVFFESNPEGQYLWIEIEAQLPISMAIAERLLSTTE
jgi:glutathione synthase/RimK-type ligase-like ATP-grasp enzyme